VLCTLEMRTGDGLPNGDLRAPCWEAMRAYSTGGVYVNFLTEDEGAERIAAAYGGSTLERLAALKRKYDPQDLFRHTKRVLVG